MVQQVEFLLKVEMLMQDYLVTMEEKHNAEALVWMQLTHTQLQVVVVELRFVLKT